MYHNQPPHISIPTIVALFGRVLRVLRAVDVIGARAKQNLAVFVYCASQRLQGSRMLIDTLQPADRRPPAVHRASK